MAQSTLVYLIKDDQILLAMKKRGFGLGKWNGVGGKVKGTELLTAAAVREAEEEVGVKIDQLDLQQVGVFDFYFNDHREWDQQMFVYFVRTWKGEPEESHEVRPEWFPLAEIPYKSMWVSDIEWLPQVIAGKKLKGMFRFNDGGSVLDTFELEEVGG